MIDRDKTINALRDIADYFRACRKNAASNGAAARRFEIYVEATEDASELLKAQEPREMMPDEAHAKLEKYGIPKYYLYSCTVGGDERG